MLKTLSAPPLFTSPDEHAQLTSSTPSSFADIPPVLHFTSDSADVSLSPLVAGWESWASSSSSEGRCKGSLWVTEEAVSFLPSTSGQVGWAIPFPALTLHALTPATSEGGPAHIYCQIDESDAPASSRSAMKDPAPTAPVPVNGHEDAHGEVNGAEDDDDVYDNEDEDEDTPMREIRIYVPDALLSSLFSALSHCSGLHASLLPNGEPSNFFGFSDNPDGPEDEWEDADGAAEDAEQDGEGGRVDPVERFLSLVDWGSVPRPAGWDKGEGGDDGDEEEEDLTIRFADAVDLREMSTVDALDGRKTPTANDQRTHPK